MDLQPLPRNRDGQTATARRPRVSLWHLYRVPFFQIVTRIWKSILADRLFGHAAELGFYFLFALFPTLFCAGSLLGLAARSAHQIYDRLLDYLALVIPTSALGAVLTTFNQTAVAATSGKVTFGFLVALWAASVGISAIQDTLNGVYRLRESRSFIMARIDAIILTLLLTAVVTLGLAALFGADLIARLTVLYFPDRFLALSTDIAVRIAGRLIALALLIFSFAVLYTWAPGWRKRPWQWFTPGAAIGIVGWLIASLGLRAYLHFFNSYSLTYGSLGAVIILLTWFYLTGLMILVGAEINSAIENAAQQGMPSIPADDSPADDRPGVAAVPTKDFPSESP
jgi:membrane protein